MRFILPLFFVAIIFTIPLSAVAQSLDDTGNLTDATQEFTASIDPQYPAPYSQATLSVLSVPLDLTNATMAVSINKKQIYDGSVQAIAIPLGTAGA